MSRCECCDEILTPFEESFRSVYTNKPLFMCENCYSSIKEQISIYADMSLEHEDGTEIANLKDNL